MSDTFDLPGTESTDRLAVVEQARRAVDAELAGAYRDLKDTRERLVATGGERDRATAELEGVRDSLAERDGHCQDLEATLAVRTGQLRECREQLDDARSEYGDKLCPRCGVAVTAEVEDEKAELAAARQELAVWRSHGTGGPTAEVVVTRYEGMGEIPAVQEGGGAS